MYDWIIFIIWLAGLCCIPDLLLLNKRPTATLAWLWAILLFPVLGAGLYLAIGTERVNRRRMKLRRELHGRGSQISSPQDGIRYSMPATEENAVTSEAGTLFKGLA